MFKSSNHLEGGGEAVGTGLGWLLENRALTKVLPARLKRARRPMPRIST